MRRGALKIALMMTASLWFAAPVQAQSRVALVIGNSTYQSVAPLRNPLNDAQAMAKTLREAGFDTVTATDMSLGDMREALEVFTKQVNQKEGDTIALVFYAGHGMQIEGENYIVPVDAKFENEEDASKQAIRLVDLMKGIEDLPSRMRIVVLDACRNNPFDKLDKKADRGLGIVDAPAGSLVAYSTAPGTEALDGNGRNSPYTTSLLKLIREPGLPVEQLFKRVRLRVHDVTDGKQTPWESSSLTEEFVFFPAATPPADAAANGVAAPAITPAAVPAKVKVEDIQARPARQAYDIAIAEDSVEFYQEFVRVHGADPLAERIRAILTRRLQTIAWRNALQVNTPDAYQTFVSQHGNSDYGRTALRLRERPRVAALDPLITRLGQINPIRERANFNRPSLPQGLGNGAIFRNNKVFFLNRQGNLNRPNLGQSNQGPNRIGIGNSGSNNPLNGQNNSGRPGQNGQNNGQNGPSNGGIRLPNGQVVQPTIGNRPNTGNNGQNGVNDNGVRLPNGQVIQPNTGNTQNGANNNGVRLPNGQVIQPNTRNNQNGPTNGGIRLPNGRVIQTLNGPAGANAAVNQRQVIQQPQVQRQVIQQPQVQRQVIQQPQFQRQQNVQPQIQRQQFQPQIQRQQFQPQIQRQQFQRQSFSGANLGSFRR